MLERALLQDHQLAASRECGDGRPSAGPVALRALADRTLQRLRLLLRALAEFVAAGGPLS